MRTAMRTALGKECEKERTNVNTRGKNVRCTSIDVVFLISARIVRAYYECACDTYWC